MKNHHSYQWHTSQSCTDLKTLNGGAFDRKKNFFLVSDSPTACATVTIKEIYTVVMVMLHLMSGAYGCSVLGVCARVFGAVSA